MFFAVMALQKLSVHAYNLGGSPVRQAWATSPYFCWFPLALEELTNWFVALERKNDSEYVVDDSVFTLDLLRLFGKR
jgi:hypothetical protein